MATSIGDLFLAVRGDLTELERQLKTETPKAGAAAGDAAGKSFGQKFKESFSRANIGKGIIQGLGIGAGISAFNLMTKAVSGTVDVLGDSLSAASAMTETQAKLGEVFKTTGDDVERWAQDAARSMGLSKQAAMENAATLGNFLQAMGQTESASADMSERVVQLAADLASFNNIAGGADEVLIALRSGLAGETEPMRRFGVDISDAAVKAQLLADGVEAIGGQFTQTQKVAARYKIMLDKTKTAQGDFARTSGYFANQQRQLEAQLADTRVELGRLLVGPATGFLDFLNNAVDVLNGPDGFRAEMLASTKSIYGMGQAIESVIADAESRSDRIGRFWSELSGNQYWRAFEQMPAIVQDWPEMQMATKAGEDFIDMWLRMGLTARDFQNMVKEGATLDWLRNLPWRNPQWAGEEQERARSFWASLYGGAADAAVSSMATTGTNFGAAIRETLGQTGAALRSFIDHWALGESIRDQFKAAVEDVRAGAAELRWAAEHPFSDMRLAMLIHGKLASQALRDGLNSEDPEVREDAIKRRNLWRLQLDGLLTETRIRAYLTSDHLQKGLNSKDPEIREKARARKRFLLDRLRETRDKAGELGTATTTAYADGLDSPAAMTALSVALSGVIQRVLGALTLQNLVFGGAPTRTDVNRGEGKASGGPVTGGMSYLVGERGPELFVPQQSGTIVANEHSGTVEVIVRDPNGGLARAGISGPELARELGRFMRSASDQAGHLYSSPRRF